MLELSGIYRLLRPCLFRLPAERAHRLAFTFLTPLQRVLERRAPEVTPKDPVLHQTLWDLQFANPIGLAAGFDKDAQIPHVWAALGFGFAELGTITAQAQPGNPAPRLFRLPADRALINRLGFNNRGARAAADTLAASLRRHRAGIPLGINLGKSRPVPLEDAAVDYCTSLRCVFPVADYITVNISSPNTPGLRDLQSAARLADLLRHLQEENRRLSERRERQPQPLLIKLSPDLADADLAAVVRAAEDGGVAGFVATNTTTSRPASLTDPNHVGETGGLSGAPLRQRSTDLIRSIHHLVGGRLPIIGCGGIFTIDDAYEKIRAGASLLQLYTGFVYEGPSLPRRLSAGLRQRAVADGHARLEQAVGSAN